MKEISIGEFARRSRLSLKALRLYDKRGVLVPSRVDRASGYRYYGTAQLEAARLVVMLRQLQLPLAAVKELLGCDPADAATRIANADFRTGGSGQRSGDFVADGASAPPGDGGGGGEVCFAEDG